MTLILGIETSCDETAASVVENGTRVRSNVIASQHELHRRYQGVVPEIASRAHLQRITPVIGEALNIARIDFDHLHAVAVGNRPGLIGSLTVGVAAAKAIAWATGKPLIGVNHVHAHLHAASMEPSDHQSTTAQIVYPALGLVVSGGHTSLYLATSPTNMKLLGKTIDDAVGEAYDKAAVIIGLGYPGGPAVDQCSQSGNPDAHRLPRSLLEHDSLDFSFSGLKTSLLYTVRGHPQGRGLETQFPKTAKDLSDKQRADLAASFQAAAVEVLIKKMDRAINILSEASSIPRCIIIGGGVSANSRLRTDVAALGQRLGLPVHIPRMEYCLDNAAMIAGLAHTLHETGAHDDLGMPAMPTVMG